MKMSRPGRSPPFALALLVIIKEEFYALVMDPTRWILISLSKFPESRVLQFYPTGAEAALDSYLVLSRVELVRRME